MASRQQRSAFFFSGRLDPPELANFQLQNVFLRDRRGAGFEMIGPGIAIWWPSRPSSDVGDLGDFARAWFRTIASAYYFETGIALTRRVVGWVEAVVGLADPRLSRLPLPDQDDPANVSMAAAVKLARRLRGTGDLERAANELLASAYDTTAQAYLSAFRSIECLRRISSRAGIVVRVVTKCSGPIST